ncbi:MAG: hypothetical protein R2824_12265 [Saprospiraceae bacterium]|nr:hypothetical protein [Lewinella sp.]
MKTALTYLPLFFLPFLSCSQNPANNITHLDCSEYWASVALSDFCSLAIEHFDVSGLVDICNADQNDNFPFDELISIRVYNAFSEASAREEYDAEEEDAMSLANYQPVDDLGDDAFAELTVEFGKLGFVIIQIVKGTYNIYIEINGNAANGSNNCLDPDTVFEFARNVVAPL